MECLKVVKGYAHAAHHPDYRNVIRMEGDICTESISGKL